MKANRGKMDKKIYKIAVCGNEGNVLELKQFLPSHLQFQTIKEDTVPEAVNEFDALFIMERNFGVLNNEIKIPVFINEVTQTMQLLQLPSKVIRVNLWPGFADNAVWEIAGELTSQHELILKELGKKFLLLADNPGLISARVISMIINEAYFTMEEGVSSEEEIDTAMKLGTNYPYGPVEWGKKIGLKKILELLRVLSTTNNKYHPAPLLEKNSI